jgi:galactokinase
VVESSITGSTLRGSYPLEEPGFTTDDPLRYAAAALVALRDHGAVLKGTGLRVESDLPSRRGLGSSAAFTILILKGLARSAGFDLAPWQFAEIAYRAEHDLLGIACGRMDQVASVHPRPVFLDFTGASMGVDEIDLPIRVPLVVGDAGGTKNTIEILLQLNRSRFGSRDQAERPARTRAQGVAYAFENLFPELVRRGKDALVAGNLRALGESMTVCQAVYDEYLRPGCPDLDAPVMRKLLETCREASALGQKWTGSGGEGAFIALAESEDHQREIADAIRAAGGGAIPVTLT